MENEQYKLVGVQSFNHQVEIGIKRHDYGNETHFQVFAGNTLINQFDTEDEAQVYIMEKLANHTDRHEKFTN